MVKRIFWLGLGLAVGAIVVHQVARQARKLTPGGIADTARKSAVGVADGARSFMGDVFDAMHEREAEIYQAMADGQLIPSDDDEDDFDTREGGTRR